MTARPGRLEVHAIDTAQDVDANRRNADLKDSLLVDKIVLGEPEEWRTEGAKCVQDPQGILAGRSDPDIDIAGRTRIAMRRDRECTDDDELSAGVCKFGQDRDEVGVHL